MNALTLSDRQALRQYSEDTRNMQRNRDVAKTLLFLTSNTPYYLTGANGMVIDLPRYPSSVIIHKPRFFPLFNELIPGKTLAIFTFGAVLNSIWNMDIQTQDLVINSDLRKIAHVISMHVKRVVVVRNAFGEMPNEEVFRPISREKGLAS